MARRNHLVRFVDSLDQVIEYSNNDVLVLKLPPCVFWLGSPEIGSDLFVRDSYRTLAEAIMEMHRQQDEPSGGVIVGGTPGTGKSTFLAYLLYCYFKSDLEFDGECVCRQGNCGRRLNDDIFIGRIDDHLLLYCAMNENGKFKTSLVQLQDIGLDRRLMLYDTSQTSSVPCKQNCFVVAACSPYSEYKEFDKRQSLWTFHIPVWELSEITDCKNGLERYKDNISDEELTRNYDQVGGIARYLLYTEDQRDHLTNEREGIINLARTVELQDALTALDNPKEHLRKVSHELIHIGTSMVRGNEQPCFKFGSDQICVAICDRARRHDVSSLFDFVDRLRYPLVSSVREMLFKEVVRVLFVGLNKEFQRCPLNFRPRTRGTTLRFSTDRVEGITAATVGTLPDRAYGRGDRTLGAIDGMVRPNLFFQVTVGNCHPVKLYEVIDILRRLGQQRGYVDFHYVVPSDKAGDFASRPFEYKDGEPSAEELRVEKRIRQWVISIDLQAEKRRLNLP